MTPWVVGLLGAAVGIGLLVVGSAWTPPVERPPRRPRLNQEALAVKAVSALAGGLVAFIATGWVVALVAGGAAGWWIAVAVVHRGRGTKREQARIEAMASWCEQLRDLLSAEQGVLGTVKATVATCPPELRPEVSRLATRIERQDPTVAVRRFAIEVDDPSGDLVASVLLLALTRSGRTSELLGELATTTRERAAMRLRVEADRAGQHSEARFVVGFAVVVFVAIVVFGRGTSFLDAYESGSGQLVFALVVALFGAGVVWLSRLSRFVRPARFLAVGESDR